nr:hypothetical protein [uncultured Massilia sp.]
MSAPLLAGSPSSYPSCSRLLQYIGDRLAALCGRSAAFAASASI